MSDHEKELVYRLGYNGDVAAGQSAVFQGGPHIGPKRDYHICGKDTS